MNGEDSRLNERPGRDLAKHSVECWKLRHGHGQLAVVPQVVKKTQTLRIQNIQIEI